MSCARPVTDAETTTCVESWKGERVVIYARAFGSFLWGGGPHHAKRPWQLRRAHIPPFVRHKQTHRRQHQTDNEENDEEEDDEVVDAVVLRLGGGLPEVAPELVHDRERVDDDGGEEPSRELDRRRPHALHNVNGACMRVCWEECARGVDRNHPPPLLKQRNQGTGTDLLDKVVKVDRPLEGKRVELVNDCVTLHTTPVDDDDGKQKKEGGSVCKG